MWSVSVQGRAHFQDGFSCPLVNLYPQIQFPDPDPEMVLDMISISKNK